MPTNKSLLKEIDDVIYDADIAKDFLMMGVECKDSFTEFVTDVKEMAQLVKKMMEAAELSELVEKKRKELTKSEAQRHEDNLTRLLIAARRWKEKALRLHQRFISFTTP